MLNSKIYSKYFPVKDTNTQFTEQEKRVLCRWVYIFDTEVRLREQEKGIKGYTHFTSYDMDKFDANVMKDMIIQNSFDEKYLAWLNIIIYRHKYNTFLSYWIFPVFTKEKARELFGEEI